MLRENLLLSPHQATFYSTSKLDRGSSCFHWSIHNNNNGLQRLLYEQVSPSRSGPQEYPKNASSKNHKEQNKFWQSKRVVKAGSLKPLITRKDITGEFKATVSGRTWWRWAARVTSELCSRAPWNITSSLSHQHCAGRGRRGGNGDNGGHYYSPLLPTSSLTETKTRPLISNADFLFLLLLGNWIKA